MNPILNNQNDPGHISLLKASSIAYTKAKRWEVFNTYFHIFLALAYPISFVIIQQDNVKIGLFGCSFLLALLMLLIAASLKGNTARGAIIKEEFDIKLFGLRWKSTLKRPVSDDIIKLSMQYRGKEIINWYSPNLSEKIPHNNAVAILQHTNTSWDIQLREKFKNLIIFLLILYSILLILFVELMNADNITKFYTAFALLSSYNYFITLIRGHASAIKKRKVISEHLDEIIQNKQDISPEDLRDIQDEIYNTRQESAKVPNFYFRKHKKKMEAISEAYIETINKLYNK